MDEIKIMIYSFFNDNYPGINVNSIKLENDTIEIIVLIGQISFGNWPDTRTFKVAMDNLLDDLSIQSNVLLGAPTI